MKIKWLFNQSPNAPAKTDNPAWLAAHNGHAHTLEWLHNSCGQLRPHIHECAVAAAAQGHNHILKILHDIDPAAVQTASPLCAAAKGGHVHTLDWLRRHGGNAYGEKNKLITAALSGGDIHVLDWLKEIGVSFKNINREARHAPIPGGHLAAMLWLKENGCYLNYPDIALSAHLHAQNDILQWAAKYCVVPMPLATARRHLDIARSNENKIAERIFSQQIERNLRQTVASAITAPTPKGNRITLKWILGL
jgi:hypothetical protein